MESRVKLFKDNMGSRSFIRPDNKTDYYIQAITIRKGKIFYEFVQERDRWGTTLYLTITNHTKEEIDFIESLFLNLDKSNLKIIKTLIHEGAKRTKDFKDI